MADWALSAMRVMGLLCVTSGQRFGSSNGQCSYTFNCDHDSQGAADPLMKNSVVILQTQMQRLIGEVADLRTDNAQLQKNNARLHQQLEAMIAGDAETMNMSAVNLKQCSRQNLNDERESGLILTCDFVKKRQDTVLRVAWNGDLRLIANGATCRRWFFTLNGAECSQPKSIETQLHVQLQTTNVHRPAYGRNVEPSTGTSGSLLRISHHVMCPLKN
ncbi:hypothetical protein NP493_265g03044 [Ridgeia piscesae]|uniref:CTHRC1 C-terminal domain-containing protein n=1 Tax=Ridgeia piscesae TaxID=27915 RepID=A0AAD9NXY7_RIDPI|nr:hypothetical protein NP493_265g03044 [Ridgeia piscesae]